MAEVVLNIVQGKLADVTLGKVGKKVERLQRELAQIKSVFRDADSQRKGDERVQNWLNELCDVAYRIEDATNTFFLEVEGHCQKNASILQNLIKKVCNKPKQLFFLHKLGNRLDDIQGLLEQISKSRVTYGLHLPVEDKSKGEEVEMPLRRAIYSEVIGMQADKNNIMGTV